MSEDISVMTAEQLVARFETQTATLGKLEKGIELTKVARSATVKALAAKAGKGPFKIGGIDMFIFNKDDTWFFSKPRGLKKDKA